MKMKKIIKFSSRLLAMMIIPSLLVACDSDVFDIGLDPAENEKYVGEQNPPIATTISEDANYSEYVKLLRYSDMFNALNQSTTGVSFTAFVPSNEAMQKFYQRRGVDSLQQLSQSYARSFILHHTASDSITAEKFVKLTTLKMLSGETITIAIDSLKAGQAVLNSEGRVVEMALPAFNGKIYVLSDVMTPLVESIYDRLAESSDYTIMAEATRQTGWDKDLATVRDTTINENGQQVVTHRYYTMLAVSDATFAKAGISSVDGLKQKLSAESQQDITADSLLRQYVAYHIVDGSYTTEGLGTMTGTDVTRIWSSSAMNQVFTVSVDTTATDEAKRYIFNQNSVPAYFTPAKSNVKATNGYVHELDNWMPVWEPMQSTVIWDLADHSDIKNLVPADYYQPLAPMSSEQRFRISDAEYFTYEEGESGSANRSNYEIEYRTNKTNIKNAVNNDRVVFNLGYMGSVQMPTPTIIRGKYKVEVSIVCLADHTFMRKISDGNGGMVRISFDDKEEYTTHAAPYTKVTSAVAGVYTSTLYDEIEFPETSSHNFKMVILDPAASTNSKFSLQIDCITFTPIQ